MHLHRLQNTTRWGNSALLRIETPDSERLRELIGTVMDGRRTAAGTSMKTVIFAESKTANTGVLGFDSGLVMANFD